MLEWKRARGVLPFIMNHAHTSLAARGIDAVAKLRHAVSLS